MNRRMKITALLLVCSALVCAIYATCFAVILNGRLYEERRTRFSDIGYLRGRINRLEAEIDDLKSQTGECIDCGVSEAQTATTTAAEASESVAETEIASVFQYAVKEYEGKICIFVIADGEEHPVRVLNIAVCTLDESDQAALADGIHADSYDKLCKILDRFE